MCHKYFWKFQVQVISYTNQLECLYDGGLVFRLEVQAVGKPKPVGKWLKQGEEIVPSEEFIIENYEDGTSVLTISQIYPDDHGEIVYEAHNPLGVAVTTTEISVEGNPRKPLAFGTNGFLAFQAFRASQRHQRFLFSNFLITQLHHTQNAHY